MEKKISFVKEVQKAVTALAGVYDKVTTLEKVYFDRGYNGGGGDEITDPDVHPHTQVSVANLASAITLLQQFKAFCNNQVVTQGDYASSINRVRNDF